MMRSFFFHNPFILRGCDLTFSFLSLCINTVFFSSLFLYQPTLLFLPQGE